MERIDLGVKIMDIQFRHSDEIIPRSKEVNEMDKEVDDNNPPPPPPPLGLPEK